MNADDFWNKVDKDLGFEQYPSKEEQDWGVINAHPNRTREFIRYFMDHDHLVPEDHRDTFLNMMTELIINSLTQHLSRHEASEDLQHEFKSFWAVARGGPLINEHVEGIRFHLSLPNHVNQRGLRTLLAWISES